MNWLKVITKNGRKSLVREILDKNLTETLVYDKCAEGSTSLLSKADIADDKRTSISGYISNGADIVTAVVSAASDGVITSVEAKDILTIVLGAFKTTLPDILESVKDSVVDRVP